MNYQQQYETSDVVSFTLKNNDHCLHLTIEGEASTKKLTLPILMDTGRFNELFDDNLCGQFISAKGKVVIDHKESKVPGTRLNLLRWEEEFLSKHYIAIGTQPIRAKEIENFRF